MIHSHIVPLTVLSEHKHLLRHVIGIDHVEVDDSVLFEEAGPRGAPVVVGGDGDELLHGDPEFVHTAKAQNVQLQVAGCGEQLQLQHIELWRETLHKQSLTMVELTASMKKGIMLKNWARYSLLMISSVKLRPGYEASFNSTL